MGPNIGQNEECKIEKCSENKIFNPQKRKNTTTVFLTYIPPRNAQYYLIRHNATSLPEIDQNRKIELIRKIKKKEIKVRNRKTSPRVLGSCDELK